MHVFSKHIDVKFQFENRLETKLNLNNVYIDEGSRWINLIRTPMEAFQKEKFRGHVSIFAKCGTDAVHACIVMRFCSYR